MQKSIRVFAAIALGFAGLPLAAQAQEKAGHFVLGGGYTAPNGEVRDRLGDGYNFVIGGQWNVNPKFGIEGLYSFNGLGDKTRTINVARRPRWRDDADRHLRQHEHAVRHDRRRPPGARGQRAAVRVGSGWACTTGRSRSPRRASASSPGYCDPWWYVCYPGGFVEVENILGERSSTDFGMVFGGGVNFGAFFTELALSLHLGTDRRGADDRQPARR